MAYIDPNTGGLLFQLLATAFAVLSGVALIFSRQIRAALARLMRSWRSLRDRGAEAVPDAQSSQTDPFTDDGQGA